MVPPTPPWRTTRWIPDNPKADQPDTNCMVRQASSGREERSSHYFQAAAPWTTALHRLPRLPQPPPGEPVRRLKPHRPPAARRPTSPTSRATSPPPGHQSLQESGPHVRAWSPTDGRKHRMCSDTAVQPSPEPYARQWTVRKLLLTGVVRTHHGNRPQTSSPTGRGRLMCHLE